MWVDHNYYLNSYLGARAFSSGAEMIPCADFTYLERRAQMLVHRYTGDVEEITDELRDCVCAVIELLSAEGGIESISGIAAEKTGDLSITYESAASRIAARESSVREVIYNYLSGTGLLYRGVNR